jgi:DNA-binding beta-propeller fold protein YncE
VNLGLDDEGYLYVADTGRRDIVVYDPAGNFRTAFANKTYDPNSKIVDVKVFKGKLFALDYGTSRIRVLDRKTGEQTAEIGFSEDPQKTLRLPGNFIFDAKGNMYATNIGSNKVMKFDLDGNLLGSFGGIGDQIGSFAKPKGIAVDDTGYIYIVDGGTNLVQMFNDQFRPLTFFGWPGLPFGSLNGPAGITVTTDNVEFFQKYAAPGFKVEKLIFVVSQFGQEFCVPRLSVYGLGQMKK